MRGLSFNMELVSSNLPKGYLPNDKQRPVMCQAFWASALRGDSSLFSASFEQDDSSICGPLSKSNGTCRRGGILRRIFISCSRSSWPVFFGSLVDANFRCFLKPCSRKRRQHSSSAKPLVAQVQPHTWRERVFRCY